MSATGIQTKDPNDYVDIEMVPKTQGSLVTVFAIWNTIMGTSLLAMPWGMERAGLFPGILVNIVVAALCLYTCYLILRINEDHGVNGHQNEVSDLARILLGKWAEFIARIFSLIVLIGSNIVYWVLMSNFLYHSVRVLYGYLLSINGLPTNSTVICPKNSSNVTVVDPLDSKAEGFDRIWDIYSTTPVILAVLMFPLLNFKSPTFFTKFNSLGTLSVMYLLIFVAVKSSTWGINMDSWVIEFNIKSTFCALSGMLSLSYFIHNIIISIMRSNRNPKNNNRDLSIAFLLVTFTYMFIGVVFYICFPLAKDCIEDNILNNFEKFDTMTIVARLLLLFQLFTVFPLISFMLRTDVFKNINLYTNNLAYEFSYRKVVAVNIVIVTICILFACFLPKIGTLIRYTGALSGLVYIFFLPSLMKIASLMKKEKLTFVKLTVYVLIVIFGFLNLISQFFIIDK
ncbi:sodium-coupled neutral amino acid transporter 9 homolog [Photinus pyralis]|uniref:sodium-coupled neutral amino acid transporter 9 homolog n=1 Tax=Photinus pyralis TaxID=7054 RepID=UPI0012670F51|nr:sodium-coupled neutral amino acid transporter 9 homolog [Photinus pyralis]